MNIIITIVLVVILFVVLEIFLVGPRRRKAIAESVPIPHYPTAVAAMQYLEDLGSADAIAEYLGERGYTMKLMPGYTDTDYRGYICPVAQFLSVTTGIPHEVQGMRIMFRYDHSKSWSRHHWPTVDAFITRFDDSNANHYPWLWEDLRIAEVEPEEINAV